MNPTKFYSMDLCTNKHGNWGWVELKIHNDPHNAEYPNRVIISDLLYWRDDAEKSETEALINSFNKFQKRGGVDNETRRFKV